jgi:hypothetical protein
MFAMDKRDQKLYPYFGLTLVAVSLCDADGKRAHPPVNGPLPDPAVVAALGDQEYPYINAILKAALWINGLGRGDEEGKAGGSPGSGSTSS